MDAQQAEEMANSMMRNSPHPDPERSEEELPEGNGSDKLPEEGDDEKLPEEEGGEELPEGTPTGKLIVPCTDRVLSFALSLVK